MATSEAVKVGKEAKHRFQAHKELNTP
ncbi:uncharacterized protein G2W53_038577 [Senna tora]|uniref:Uncharacterized protein n=1 Tax=Senna tora TaxID=362788 RepID=A0A834SMU0_9FABA|nr:uncharacterized protein G2W53_038577 [Senna tora]